jgi:uncharacterized protein
VSSISYRLTVGVIVMRDRILSLVVLGVILFVAGCTPGGLAGRQAFVPPTAGFTPETMVTAAAVPTGTPSPTPSLTGTATPAPTDTTTPTATATPTAAPTADPYAGLTIDDLTARSYGEGEITVLQRVEANDAFVRYLITYPSDGLTIHAFMNVPEGEGPFPVVVVLHGYIPPERYTTLAYTRYADALARAGYVALHPNLRNFPPSDKALDRFRVGAAIDALNLVGLVRQHGGQPGPLERADPTRIGMWGHSMGGGITIRAIMVDAGISAAVLYGSMNADERINGEQRRVWAGGEGYIEELDVPEGDLARISPATYLDRIVAPVSIHHSEDDQTVPVEWSVALCERLEELGKAVECYTYSGVPHTFNGPLDVLFMERYVAFFDRHLKAPGDS